MHSKQRITPFLSQATQVEEAAEFYVSVVLNSRVVRSVLNPANQSVLTVEFERCRFIIHRE